VNYTITATDMAAPSIVNVARASASFAGSPVRSAPVQVTVTSMHPAISVTKTVSPASLTLPGGQVTYSFVVTDSGDTTLSPVVLTDNVLGPIGVVPSMAPGQSITITKAAVVDASTPPTNTVKATGTDPMGTPVTATAQATFSLVAGLVLTPAPPPAATPAPTLAFTGGPTGLNLLLGASLAGAGWLLVRTTRRPRAK
jgi:hypothetical protein